MRKLVILVLALLVIAGLPLIALAAKTNQASETIYLLNAEENFAGNLYQAASDLTIEGKVVGDVFVAGNKVTINGEISGSVFAAGQEIIIGDRAKVSGNLYLAASTISFTGKAGGNLYAFGSIINSTDKSEVAQDFYAFGGSLNINGEIKRDLRGSAGTAILKAVVGRDVQFYEVNELHLEKGTAIGRNLTYRSENDAQIADDVTIAQKTEKQKPVTTTKEEKGDAVLNWLAKAIYGLFAFLAMALVIVLIFPHKTKMISESIAQKFGSNLLAGLIVLIVVPVVSLMLFFTLIGIPVALILLVFYGIILYAGKLFVGVIAGRYLIDRFFPKWSEKTRLIIGVLKGAGIIYVLTLIPVLGGIIGFLATLLAFGAIWTERGRFDLVGVEIKTDSK